MQGWSACKRLLGRLNAERTELNSAERTARGTTDSADMAVIIVTGFVSVTRSETGTRLHDLYDTQITEIDTNVYVSVRTFLNITICVVFVSLRQSVYIRRL